MDKNDFISRRDKKLQQLCSTIFAFASCVISYGVRTLASEGINPFYAVFLRINISNDAKFGDLVALSDFLYTNHSESDYFEFAEVRYMFSYAWGVYLVRLSQINFLDTEIARSNSKFLLVIYKSFDLVLDDIKFFVNEGRNDMVIFCSNSMTRKNLLDLVKQVQMTPTMGDYLKDSKVRFVMKFGEQLYWLKSCANENSERYIEFFR